MVLDFIMFLSTLCIVILYSAVSSLFFFAGYSFTIEFLELLVCLFSNIFLFFLSRRYRITG